MVPLAQRNEWSLLRDSLLKGAVFQGESTWYPNKQNALSRPVKFCIAFCVLFFNKVKASIVVNLVDFENNFKAFESLGRSNKIILSFSKLKPTRVPI